ncbi:MAG: ATP-binding protein [Acidimicrobiales bacterium]|nr:ATP-binding protein [Acidimicrobiales bacterium]MYD82106.1 ATP-binding protein [Acidimicrobiales bacterium]MYJ47229.1 ATP-binding protein [Acidimicrobiales bacterium]MYJ66869.1 ATP-binding protein [Acidimicrobiales bacterium]
MLTGGLPAVVIEGPRAVGKTETALRRARTVHRLDDGRQLAIVRGDPERLLAGSPPILIDEWQRYPDSWDMVRRRVDADPGTARFLLTGSAAPATRPTHSGAGRMVTLRMHPMSLAERGITEPTVSLAELLSGSRPLLAGRSAMKLSDYALEIERSGFPAIRELDRGLRERQIGSYLDRVVEHDIDDLGTGVRDRASLRRWLEAFAAATATTAAYTSIRDAATPGAGDPPSMATVAAYRRVMEQMWIVEELPAWLPTRSRLRRLAASPKHHLADPALAMSSLGINAEALLDGIATPQATQRDGTLLGHLFESLVAQSVRVYAQASRARVSHLRTRGGEQEVDLIVERRDGNVVALEVKLTAAVEDSDVRHLRWLTDRIGDNLLDAAVISTGNEAYRRQDGIGVIPAALLGA